MIQNSFEYYNKNANRYFIDTKDADMSLWRDKFISYLPQGGRIMDVGCGSGRDSKAFIKAGFSVVAFDASEEMCKLASDYLSQEVWQMRFDQMSFHEEFDGVWACASLLHIPFEEMIDILKKIYDSLIPNGYFYASLKKGNGERKSGERIFYNYSIEKAYSIFEKTSFRVVVCEESVDVRPERKNEMWINIIARKEKLN